MSEVTRILSAIEQGNPSAASQLLPLVYDELRKFAAAKMANERPGHTFEATALVHEAYLSLVGGGQEGHWNSRGHFFAAAAEAMRRILIGNARQKQALKRGGHAQRVDLDAIELAECPANDKLLALEDALIRLTDKDPVKGELVKLRYFAGLTTKEAAAVLGISTATADRYWAYARRGCKTKSPPPSKGDAGFLNWNDGIGAANAHCLSAIPSEQTQAKSLASDL